MGEVEPALAGNQELAAGRTLGLVQVDVPPGRTPALGGEQAGRATADHGDPTLRCGITSGGIINVRLPPTFMPATPSSQPRMTWPAPSAKVNGSPRLTELSKVLPCLVSVRLS
ncbi:hypothetical protein G6F57_019831 [Rhizopus arrhizus]|nr:hypothetical protein G6F57_019831 [Rhizopus arrhizus]